MLLKVGKQSFEVVEKYSTEKAVLFDHKGKDIWIPVAALSHPKFDVEKLEVIYTVNKWFIEKAKNQFNDK